MKRKKNERNIDWHSGFAGGLGLCFRRYRDKITIEREHLLSKQPLRVDFLVLKKQAGVIQVSYDANIEMFKRLRGDSEMCDALRELMADDLAKERDQRDKEKIAEMLNDGKSPEAIVDFCKYPLKLVLEVQADLEQPK